LATYVYRKPTHSDRYLNFRFDHPILHKQSIARALMDCAHFLASTTKDGQAEIKHIRESLQLNSYPQHSIIRKQRKVKQANEQTKSIAILPYYPGLTEKLKRCLSNHNIKTVTKPCNTIGYMLSKHKDLFNPNQRQGAIY